MKKSNKRPIAFSLVSTNHGSLLVNRHDYILVENGGVGIGFQILHSSSFDQEEVDIALQLLDSRKKNYGTGVVALDCGANIGAHTIEWAQFMHGWGEVLAFEAQERIFYALAGNITMNNCFNARAIWAAVGSATGSIGVPVPDYFKPSSFGSLEIEKKDTTEFIGQEIDYSENKTQQTHMVAIDDLNLQRLDFVKIDIEGMEMAALNGGIHSIGKFKPQMMIETIKSNELEIRTFLTNWDYKFFPLGLGILAVHQSDPVLPEIAVT